MWLTYAIFSALTAALVAIFAKLGLKTVDSTLATTIRAIIMAAFLVGVSTFQKKFEGFSFASLSHVDWLLITLSGLAGAASWLFYFLALKFGKASQVAAVDRSSLVFVVIFAVLFLGESLTWKALIGVFLMLGGALLITFG